MSWAKLDDNFGEVSDLDAEAGLLLFPGFYDFVSQLKAKLEERAKR